MAKKREYTFKNCDTIKYIKLRDGYRILLAFFYFNCYYTFATKDQKVFLYTNWNKIVWMESENELSTNAFREKYSLRMKLIQPQEGLCK